MQTNGSAAHTVQPPPAVLPTPARQPAAALGQLTVLLLTLATAGLQLSVVWSLRDAAADLAAERRAAAARSEEDAERERLVEEGQKRVAARQADAIAQQEEAARIAAENVRRAREINRQLRGE